MRRHRLGVCTAVIVGLAVGLALPAGAAEDLTSWTSSSYAGDGSIFTQPGQWDVSAAGTEVVQVVNGAPTFFISPGAVAGYRITAEFVAPITEDDDFFGVGLGLASPVGNPTDDYLLIDWKQADQTINWFGGGGAVLGSAGLAVSRVSGVPAWDELWGHLDQPEAADGAVSELARGVTLGHTGWVPGTSYQFVIEYTTTSLRLWVDGSLELDLAGTFPDGSFALYDFSLAGLEASAGTLTPLNSPPEVVGSGADDVIGNEGETGTTSGSFSDPDADDLVLSCAGACTGFIDSGDGSWQWSELLVEGPAASSVTITASDGLESVSDTFTVDVVNLAPVIVAIAGVPDNHDIRSPLAVAADFTDAGVLDTHTAVFDWGDGSATPGVIEEDPGSGSASADHTYSTQGVFTVTVTVWDDDGGWDRAIVGEVLIFDPDTFVTGGGWVSSPVGAWVDEPSQTGKATFGFVVRYDDNGAVRGDLQFSLHNGITLHAQGFDFLLIDEGIAEFSGWGLVNGDRGFRFRVVATDQRYAGTTEDLFWITITEAGETVYDGSVYPAGRLPTRGLGIQVHT